MHYQVGNNLWFFGLGDLLEVLEDVAVGSDAVDGHGPVVETPEVELLVEEVELGLFRVLFYDVVPEVQPDLSDKMVGVLLEFGLEAGEPALGGGGYFVGVDAEAFDDVDRV